MAAASNDYRTLKKTEDKINFYLSLGPNISKTQKGYLDKLNEHFISLKEKLSRRNKSYSKSKSRSKSRSPNLLGGYRQTKNKSRKTRRN
jgi:hypothetical protein